MSFDLYFTASPYASSDLLPTHTAQPPVVSAIRNKGFEHCAAGKNDAARLDHPQRIVQTSLEVAQVLQRVRQKTAIVSIGRQSRLRFGQVANVCRFKAWIDIETICPHHALSELSRVPGALHFQNVAGDLTTMPLQEAVQIVPVDRCSSIKPVFLRKRTRTSKIAPNRQSFSAKNA